MIKKTHRLVKKGGVVMAVINGHKLLMLKRRNLPFITHRGIWYFVSGGTKRNEGHIDTAYRELREETGIERSKVKLITEFDVTVLDNARMEMWTNRFFVLASRTDKIKLNIEHGSYKWVDLDEFLLQDDALNTIYNRRAITRAIEYAMKRKG